MAPSDNRDNKIIKIYLLRTLASCNTIFDGGCYRERSGHFIFDKNRELAHVRN